MGNRNALTYIFNIALFFYLCVDYSVSFLFEPVIEQKIPWDHFFELSPILSIILAFIIALLLLAWGAKLAQIFWNRLISNIFKCREINYQEAISIAIIIAILFS